MRKLQGKVAIVTGSSMGIGADIAKGFATEGASVVVNYPSEKENANKVLDEIAQAGGKAIAVMADISVEADVIRLFEETRKAFGRLDVLVNNAGVYKFAPIEEVTPELFHLHFNINVLGTLLACRQAVKLFGDRGGSIINLASAAIVLNLPTSSVYAASKSAINTITAVLAKELGPRKIRVNSISPGLIDTEGTHAAGFIGSDLETSLAAQTPLGRTGRPSDITPIAVFLASEESGWLTGENLVVSGGLR
jgi:3-oxoacyl-[acyl-carrier protein] reductase